MDNCRICYKPLGVYKHNNQVYCGDACYKIGKATKMRVINQRKNMPQPRKCKRCLKTKTESGMKLHCKSCIEILKIPKKKKVDMKVCKRCDKVEVTGRANYCLPCREERKLEQIKYHNSLRKTRKPCRGCQGKIPEKVPSQARYCSDECKKKYTVKKPKVKTEKKKTNEINPLFVQPRGSKRRKELNLAPTKFAGTHGGMMDNY